MERGVYKMRGLIPANKRRIFLGALGAYALATAYNYIFVSDQTDIDALALARVVRYEARKEPSKGQEAVRLVAALRAYYGRYLGYPNTIRGAVYQKIKGRYLFDGIRKIGFLDNKIVDKILVSLPFYSRIFVSDADYNIATFFNDKNRRDIIPYMATVIIGSPCALFYKNDKIARTENMKNINQRKRWRLRIPVSQIGRHSFYIDPKEMFYISKKHGPLYCF